ncbi:uncharacterized protein A4U43_C05F1060 [Asparagus officinalis]|uniref:Myb-like domain-containing protein n=1 Tax=Asparagus officinalis TaxID=4686 RepID=A0A5P1ENM8_ASPOF|nr:uncharacterized protein A4U43_C05F1060 [Asparagus officinalis]
MPKATPLSSMSEATPMRSDLSSSSSSNEYRKRLRSHQTPTRVTISNGSNKENVGIENFGVELVKEKNNGEKKRGERDGLLNLKIFEKKENVGVENLGAKIVKEKDNFEKRRGEKDGLVNFKNKENVGIGNFGVKMEKEKNNVEKKRKMERCCEEGIQSIQSCGSDDWTRQQEAALQRAYLAAKPSPHFWKKVAKMVPGKSAQDCFDRVNSSFDTPPQPQPRSRAIKSKLSPISNFSLSCSKPIQNPSQPVKKLSSRKKSLVAQKTVRHFLKKHSEKDQNHQVDHFSVLETSPDALVVDLLEINSHIDPTCPLSPPNFLQKCSGGLSSGHQKMLSRFKPNNPSPEVLKRVKNVALHEKYIDQLHNRDARRKSVAARVCKNVDEVKIGGLKAAKTALMSEAREFISQFQHMRANCQCDADIDDDDDEEMEEEDDE